MDIFMEMLATFVALINWIKKLFGFPVNEGASILF